MKRNKLVFMLSVPFLAVSLLTGCNAPSGNSQNANSSAQPAASSVNQGGDTSNAAPNSNNQGQPSSNNQGRPSSNNQGGQSSNNQGGQSSNNQGGNSNSQGGNNSSRPVLNNLPNGAEELAKLRAANGYEFNVTMTDRGETHDYVIGAKANDEWYCSGNEGYGFRTGDKFEEKDITHLFALSASGWGYQYALVDASLLTNALDEGFGSIILGDDEVIAQMNTMEGTKEKLLNRDVTKFVITVDGESATVYVDNQYGFALKIEANGYNLTINSISINANVPYANVVIPDDYSVYADYMSSIMGSPINGPKLKAPEKLYVKYETYSLDGEKKSNVIGYVFMKDGNGSLSYTIGNSHSIAQYEAKADNSGYVLHTGVVSRGRANWSADQNKTNDDFQSNLSNTLAPSTYLANLKAANAAPNKDKTIAGVACKAYQCTNDMMGITSIEYEFYVDPNTNIVFYGYSKVTYDGEVYETVAIDIKEFSANLTNSYYDHACESMLYREVGYQESDTHHVQSEPGVIREATCSEKGATGSACIYCGYEVVSGELPIDPNNHDQVADYWYDDGEGHHYRYCYSCGQIAEQGNHECDESSLHPTCSGVCTVKCSACENEIEFEVEKSATHTYCLSHYDCDSYGIWTEEDIEEDVAFNWHCDCWYLSEWDREGDAGDDLTWAMPKLSNEEYWTKGSSYGGTTYTAKKDALITSLKVVWANESDEDLGAWLDTALYNLGAYNGKFTIYSAY